MIRALLLLSLVAGCTETIRVQADSLDGLESLEVYPPDAVITVTDLAPPEHTLQYIAIGRFSDGTTREVTSLVGWSVDNVRIGALDGNGLFTATQTAAGHGVVTVRAHGQMASTPMTVIIDASIVDTAFPPPRAGLFAGAPLPGGPAPTYPTSGTRFPQGVASTLFQYGTATYDAYRLRFDSDVLHLAVETGANRWRADGAMQRILEGSGVEGAIALTIDATTAVGTGNVYASTPIMLEYSRDRPETPLFFWSASTNGVMRGSLATSTASKLYPSSGVCVGCHALSKDASRMAVGYDNTISTDLEQFDLATLAPTIPASTRQPMGWATYSPDGTHLVVANNGALAMYDSTTGASLGAVPLPTMRYATHPDWSPDGRYLAVALTSQTPNNLDVKAASIARIPYNDGAWGAPEVLVSGSSTNNNYFPKWSPDGRYLAFVHATSASQGAKSAELLLLPAEGGSPKYLATASHRVGGVDAGDLANTMPAWGPPQPEHQWLAFVSSRQYGDVLATGDRAQVWITSLDLDAPADSSSPAFWLPCQDVTVVNNNPVWTNQVVTN
ncbi:MAG TPA: hypothetical protein VMZ53_22670 [Kofleriaceae bacterium]|nr:hypothetical protein [Kofleriaceae bacterium]